MSIGEIDTVETARSELQKAIASGSTTWSALERKLEKNPTRQALKSFHDGTTDDARYWKRLLRILRGEPDSPDLVEEATRALKMIREGQEILARVVSRMGGGEVVPGPTVKVRLEDLQAAEDGDQARADLEAKIAGAKKRPRGSAGGGA